jgi:hypothetical protein
MKLGPGPWLMEEIHDDPGRGYSPIGSDSLIVPWCIIPIFDFDVSWGEVR